MSAERHPKFVLPPDHGKSKDQSNDANHNVDATSADSSFMDLQTCCDALGSLLSSQSKVQALDPKQVSAIRHLRSVSFASVNSSDQDEGCSLHESRRGKLLHKLRSHREKMKSKRSLDTFVCQSMREMEEYGNDESFQVLDFFGGGNDHDNVGGTQSRGHNRGSIILNRGRRSGHRIKLLFSTYRGRLSHTKRDLLGGSLRLSDTTAKSNQSEESRTYCPPEWKALTAEAKGKLANILTFESLSTWSFDIVEVAKLSRCATNEQCCPLLLVGWALLCEPMAQEVMQNSAGVKGFSAYLDGTSDESEPTRYQFTDHLTINADKICNFLREIESRYKAENPYHNNIHAADVMQSTHCLLQMMDVEHMRSICDPVTVFSLLLAASFHDVGHPGTTNLFQQNAMTPLAIRYNDVSILESMHSAVGHSLLMGEEKKDELDVFDGWSHEDKIRARSIMTSAILHTDMASHFAHVEEMDSLIDRVQMLYAEYSSTEEEDINTQSDDDEPEPILSILAKALDGEFNEEKLEEECRKLADGLIKFLMHAADISNPAKPQDMRVYWAGAVMSEFFAQGDLEKKLGLPISPLCDREAVKIPDSSIGFAKFVVQPTFEFLSEVIPRVKDDILPRIDDTLTYWQREKSRQSKCRRTTLESIEEKPTTGE